MATNGWRVVALLWRASPAMAFALGAFVVASAVLPNAVLLALGQVVSIALSVGSGGLTEATAGGLTSALVLAGALYLTSLAVGPVFTVLSTSVRTRLTFVLRSELMEAVGRPPGIAHLEQPSVQDELDLAQNSLLSHAPADGPATLAQVVANRFSGLLACVVLAHFQPLLGLGVLALWLGIRVPIIRVVREQVTAFRGRTGGMRRANYLFRLATTTDGAKEIRVFDLSTWLVASFRSCWSEGTDQAWQHIRRLRGRLLLLGVLVLAAYGAACAYLGWAALHREITVGQLAVLLPMLAVSEAVGSLSNNDIGLAWMMSALPRSDRVRDRLESMSADLPGLLSSEGRPQVEIRLSGVRFRYPGGDRDVFRALDMVIPAGRSTAIVGLNGAGKTTLVKLLTRLHDPVDGRITVDDVDLSELCAPEWQQRVAVVFQDFVRFPLSLLDNVCLGGPAGEEADVEGVADALHRAGAGDLVHALPQGLRTTLSPQYAGGVDLSAGQWQRVALARAIHAIDRGARVLVMDEPTAWQDARIEAEFFERCLSVARGCTTVIISHRLSNVRHADIIQLLADGAVREIGDHDTLVAGGGRYAEMFERQAARFDDHRGPP